MRTGPTPRYCPKWLASVLSHQGKCPKWFVAFAFLVCSFLLAGGAYARATTLIDAVPDFGIYQQNFLGWYVTLFGTQNAVRRSVHHIQDKTGFVLRHICRVDVSNTSDNYRHKQLSRQSHILNAIFNSARLNRKAHSFWNAFFRKDRKAVSFFSNRSPGQSIANNLLTGNDAKMGFCHRNDAVNFNIQCGGTSKIFKLELNDESASFGPNREGVHRHWVSNRNPGTLLSPEGLVSSFEREFLQIKDNNSSNRDDRHYGSPISQVSRILFFFGFFASFAGAFYAIKSAMYGDWKLPFSILLGLIAVGLVWQGIRLLAAIDQTSSSLTFSVPIATRDASKNVAENVPRLILLAMDASVSFRPCFLSRSASSRYPMSARANSAFSNRLARSSHKGVCGPS